MRRIIHTNAVLHLSSPSPILLTHLNVHVNRAMSERGCTRILLLGDAHRSHLVDFDSPNALLSVMQLGRNIPTIARACEEEEETAFIVMGDHDLGPIVRTILTGTRLWDPVMKGPSSFLFATKKNMEAEMAFCVAQMESGGWITQPLPVSAIYGTDAARTCTELIVEAYGDGRYQNESVREFD